MKKKQNSFKNYKISPKFEEFMWPFGQNALPPIARQTEVFSAYML
jgi:hypothetical protein